MFHVTDNIGHYTAPTPTTNAIAPSHPLLLFSPLIPINHQSNIQFMLFHCQCIAVHCCALLCIEEAKTNIDLNIDLTINKINRSHHSS